MKIKNLAITSPSVLDLELDITSPVCLLSGEHSDGNGSCFMRMISAEHIDGYRACLLDMGKHEAIDWEDERWK